MSKAGRTQESLKPRKRATEMSLKLMEETAEQAKARVDEQAPAFFFFFFSSVWVTDTHQKHALGHWQPLPEQDWGVAGTQSRLWATG